VWIAYFTGSMVQLVSTLNQAQESARAPDDVAPDDVVPDDVAPDGVPP
jgi:hypothetical protein